MKGNADAITQRRFVMFKTCQWCGIVTLDHDCPHKNKIKYKQKNSKADNFRNTSLWQKKRTEIKGRDLYLCRACIANIPPTQKQLNYKNLEVHHIIKLTDDYDRRLDNDNLITLCSLHHKMADDGKLTVKQLKELISDTPPPVLK